MATTLASADRCGGQPGIANTTNTPIPSTTRILRAGKAFRIKGQIRLGELKGDRAIAIRLIMKPGRVRHDREEIVAKKLLTEKDFAMMDEGRHPDEEKSTPNEMPEMRIGDIDHLTEQEADDYCKLHKVLVPAGADLLVKRQYIKRALSTTR